MIKIDIDTRCWQIPKEECFLGVESDDKVKILQFELSKNEFCDGLNFTDCNCFINYKNEGNDTIPYLITDMEVQEDGTVTFTWEVSRGATIFKGNTFAILCAKKVIDDGTITNEWNSRIGSFTVSKGLEPLSSITEVAEIDIISQLLLSAKTNIDKSSSLLEKAEGLGYLKEEYDVLEARMNQFTSLKEGSTTGDAELQDIRVGADGKTYDTAGDAVRGQIGELKGDLDTLNRGGLLMKEDFIGQQVNEWLDEHPEATTTVQDGSITEPKLKENFFRSIKKSNTLGDFSAYSEDNSCVRDSVVNGVSINQYTCSDSVIERMDIETTGYGVFVGEQSSEKITENVIVKDSKIKSLNGNRTRTNKSGQNKNISFINNTIETTGDGGAYVGIEVWTPESNVIGNHIKKNGNTGFSGITCANGKSKVIANYIAGFASALEIASDISLVSDNIVENSDVGIYVGSPVVNNVIFSNNIFKNVKLAISLDGGIKYCEINNCKFVYDSVNNGSRLVYARRGEATSLHHLRLNNCHIHNYRGLCDVKNYMVEFNNCLFTSDEPISMGSNWNHNFNSCTFINVGVRVYNGYTSFNSCSFTGYSSLYNGQPIDKGSGANPLLNINNCKFDNPNDGRKVFGYAPSAENQQYQGGIFNGVFYAYNRSGGSEIIALENFKNMVGNNPILIKDSYKGNTYFYNGSSVKEITN